MSKRFPKQHEIDELACKQFANVLPPFWLVRDQLKDYGIDKEVEVFEKGISTGIIFKVQVKGTENTKFTSDCALISFSLSLDDAIYFCEELNVPMVLVLCDVKSCHT